MRKKLLITGGTVFVSKFITHYFVNEDYDVYVLNRNTKKQVENVHLICADRNHLTDELKDYHFDVVIDVCAYAKQDIKNLIEHLNPVKDYIFISSSAVYPETNPQPFNEKQEIGLNSIWGQYGINKIEAEQYLISKIPQAYIIRPPYLYGPMQNVYREPFVFDCALQDRPFYIPQNGEMKLQFFHVEDLCKVIHHLFEKHPLNHTYNVGNKELVDINAFVELCYKVVGIDLNKIHVYDYDNQRDYFPFYNYEYILDISEQNKILPKTKDLFEGLKESHQWYIHHPDDVLKKDFISFIDENFIKKSNLPK